MRNCLCLSAVILLFLACGPAHAGETRIELTPAAGSVGIRAYRLGLFPLDGAFARFHGWLIYDPANRTDCRVELHVDVPSLAMGSADMTQRVLGSAFLDAARYPSLMFRGACAGARLDGSLAMHGVARPFVLALDWRRRSVTATGRLRRADWGMTALPILVGATVRIAVLVHLAGPPRAGP